MKVFFSLHIHPLCSNANRVPKLIRHVAQATIFLVLNNRTNMAFSIASLCAFFENENKSISRGENHYKSNHIESCIYLSGVLKGKVRASMKDKVYNVTVSYRFLAYLGLSNPS